MKNNFLKNTALLLLLLIFLFLFSHSITYLLPGDPIALLLENYPGKVNLEDLKIQLGLHLSWHESLSLRIKNYLHGNLGFSLIHGKNIGFQIFEGFEITFKLALLSSFFTLISSWFIGVFSNSLSKNKFNSFLSNACDTYGVAMASTPVYWVGFCIFIFFSFYKGPSLSSLTLATFTLTISLTGFWSRYIKDRIKDQISPLNGQQAAIAAKARGIHEFIILIRYGWKPVAPEVLGYFGTQFGKLLAGAIVVETVFNLEGLGSLFLTAVLSRDFPLLETLIFFTSSIILIFSYLGLTIQSFLDPRLGDLK
ncbi:MAG: hypothetical protein CL678_10180 [Bdellovibrionaceae bacterium]|nr:hypothetical protein [Pseudobdellovibrionaceae bacterium]|tara:strand:+ start:1476 stop:2402 length:927 start_codon:yes stop_codon:yes gene_type:complete